MNAAVEGKRPQGTNKLVALHPPTRSDDTVRILLELLEDARRGDCVGVALAAMYRNREYLVTTAGECRQDRSRTFTRGMVMDLNEKLANSPAQQHSKP